LLLDAVVVAVTVGIGAIGRRPLHLPYAAVGATIGGAVCLAMLVVAAVIKPDGRAEVASRLVNDGFRHAVRGSNHPAAGAAAVALMVIALYGSFAWVEGIRRALARRKVSAADAHEVARILATVCATPAGVSIAMLRKHGQPIDALRLPVAALLLDGWVVLRDGGRVVQQRSSAERRRRPPHPLVELFAPPCDVWT
jgi:hypothetical protein